MSEHELQTPYVARTGERMTSCSCGQVLRAPTIDELTPLMAEHVGRPARESVADTTRCAGCGRPTTNEHWPFCIACRQLQADVDPSMKRADQRRADRGSAAYSVVVVLTGSATLGAALRFGGWLRFVLVIAAVVLVSLALRLDARPPVRRE